MSSRAKKIMQLGRKLYADLNNEALTHPEQEQKCSKNLSTDISEKQVVQNIFFSKSLSEPSASSNTGHKLGNLPSTSSSNNQELLTNEAGNYSDIHDNPELNTETVLSISEDELLEDHDYPQSSSDNYEPSLAASETGSRTSSVHVAEDTAQNIPKKRKRDENKWKKNVRKAKRLKGESYIGHRKIKKPSRPLLPVPCLRKPKHKCSDLVNEEERLKIYKGFRGLSHVNDQRQFLSNHIEQKQKNRTTRKLVNSRKTYTCVYSFTVNRTKCIVCREFFMSTLNVTDAFMRSSLKKRSMSGILEKDKRGKHTPANKLKEDEVMAIREHILSFPAVESHYCRKKSSKRYLDACLNISIMYRMYKNLCNTKKIKPVTLEKYRQIFNEYNLGFFKPKKDQCKKCLAQKNLAEEERQKQELDYKNHLERKEAARRARDYDKTVAKEDPRILAFNFDLQAVLTTPKGYAGEIFYLRKLAVYNLTVYNLGNQDVRCYVWDETQGKRGANEIATCIYDFIMSHSDISGVRMMSDGCGGQQKNSFFAAMCLKICANHPSLRTIDHQFFETGHTEMECDSIHSKIEKKAKHVPVYIPEGWAQVIRDSRIMPRPFIVKSLTFDDFLDFKAFSLSNAYKFSEIPWRKVCGLHYTKEHQSKVFYRTDFAGDFIEVDCSKSTKSRGRPKQVLLLKAYENTLPIADLKWENLQTMCKDLTIPKAYHNYYTALKTDKDVRDNLPQPDAEESEGDTDTEA